MPSVYSNRQYFPNGFSDFISLPWPDWAFDAALFIAAIHHKRRVDIVRALAEVLRILKPSGMFPFYFPCVLSFSYNKLRQDVAEGRIAEDEPNPFVDERPDSVDPDGMLPHHFCDKTDLRDLLGSFELVRMWTNIQHIILESDEPSQVGKWVAWVDKPLAD